MKTNEKSNIESKDKKLRELLLRVIDKTAKIAKRLLIATIPILIINLIVGGIGFYYFFNNSDLGNWRWGVPLLIMGMPLLAIAAVMYILDAVIAVPSAVRASSGDLMKIVKHHREKLETADSKKLSKFKYLRTVGKILWDSSDVVGGVSMASFMATPIFWFLYLLTFLGSLILSIVMILTMVIHHLMT